MPWRSLVASSQSGAVFQPRNSTKNSLVTMREEMNSKISVLQSLKVRYQLRSQ